VASVLGRELKVTRAPEIVGRYRHGDIRHCFADISLARRVLGYEPRVEFPDGMRELAAWIAEETPAAEDRVEGSTAELAGRGLVL
jgi:dTDP-L-rhamnose 4-epimerase